MTKIKSAKSVLCSMLVLLGCCTVITGQESGSKSSFDDIVTQYAKDLKKWESDNPSTVSGADRQIQRFESWPAWELLSKLEMHLDSSDDKTLYRIACLVRDIGNAIGPGESQVGKLEAMIFQRVQASRIEEKKLCFLISKLSPPSKPRHDLLRFCLNEEQPTQVRAVASLVLFRSNMVLLDENHAVLANASQPETKEIELPTFQEFYNRKIDPSHFGFVSNMNVVELAQSNEHLYQKCLTEYKDELLVVDEAGQTGMRIGKMAELCRRQYEGRKIASDTKLRIGEVVPSIDGADLEGRSLSLSRYRGRIIVLDFWASWCGPCMEKLPKMQELADKYRDEPVVFVGINADVDPQDARQAAEKAAISWSSFHFGNESERLIGQVLKVREFPTVYIVDSNGILRVNDQIDVAEIDKALRKLLEQQTPKR